MPTQYTITPGLVTFICVCFGLAAGLALMFPAPGKATVDPSIGREAGKAFVAQLDADRVTNPVRHGRALKNCVDLDRHGRVDWTKAKACYDRL